MKALFLDIFEYHHHINQRLIEELKKHGRILPKRTMLLFCHIVNAHQIWNGRILDLGSVGVNDVHSPEQCKYLDEENFRTTEDILHSQDFERQIAYVNSAGQRYQNTIPEILFHISNHSTHHRGQIISSFRQCHIEPLMTDYIFYKR